MNRLTGVTSRGGVHLKKLAIPPIFMCVVLSAMELEEKKVEYIKEKTKEN